MNHFSQKQEIFRSKTKGKRFSLCYAIFCSTFFLFIVYITLSSESIIGIVIGLPIVIFFLPIMFLIILLYSFTYLIIYEDGVICRSSGLISCLNRRYIYSDQILTISTKEREGLYPAIFLCINIKNEKPVKIQEEFIGNINEALKILKNVIDHFNKF